MSGHVEPPNDGGDRRAWHQALVYGLLGRRQAGFGEQVSPDLALLRHELETDGAESLGQHARDTLDRGETWPHPVPPDLMEGLGYAQFAAALTELREALGLLAPTAVRSSSAARAAPTAAEQRLLDDVPPHHGR